MRLRKPERRQMEWVAQCTDDLVGPTHGVRTVVAVVAQLDLAAFRESIKAREGVAGRDSTDPRCWCRYGCMPASGASGRHGNWRGAVRRACPFAGCVAG